MGDVKSQGKQESKDRAPEMYLTISLSRCFVGGIGKPFFVDLIDDQLNCGLIALV